MGTTFQKEIVVLNSTEHLVEARQAVSAALEASPFNPSERRLVAVAVDEALSNLVRNAKQEGREGHTEIRLSIDLNPVRLSILVTDDRNDFYREAVDETLARDQKLGLVLIRQIMDEIQYVYRRGIENTQQMVKFTPSE